MYIDGSWLASMLIGHAIMLAGIAYMMIKQEREKNDWMKEREYYMRGQSTRRINR